MAKIDTKMKYDEEENILSLSKGKKIKSSIDIGDFVIDVDKEGFVSGIEILNASENLKLGLKQLKEIVAASMTVNYKPHNVYIYLILKFKEKEKEITIPLSLDLGHAPMTQKTSFAVA